jgi:hypothetical protein
MDHSFAAFAYLCGLCGKDLSPPVIPKDPSKVRKRKRLLRFFVNVTLVTPNK